MYFPLIKTMIVTTAASRAARSVLGQWIRQLAFWVYWGEPALDATPFGTLCFGDFELTKNRLVVNDIRSRSYTILVKDKVTWESKFLGSRWDKYASHTNLPSRIRHFSFIHYVEKSSTLPFTFECRLVSAISCGMTSVSGCTFR